MKKSYKGIGTIRTLHKEIAERIGDELKRLRNTLELSRQKVSDSTGIPVTMITQYERDGILPSQDRLTAMLAIYGVSESDFLLSIELPSWKDVLEGEAHA